MPKKNFLYLSIIIWLSSSHFWPLFAQHESNELSKKEKSKELRKLRPSYLAAGSHTGIMKLRDTGTSPRFYNGLVTGAAFSIFLEDSIKLSDFYADIAIMNLNDGFDPLPKVWSGGVFSVGGGTIWKLRPAEKKKIKLGLGYSFRTFTVLRENDDLRNAGFGLDHISSLGVSGGLFFPFERKSSSVKKLWFLSIKSNPRKFNLSYQWHIPILNVFITPEYAYLTNVIDPSKNSFDTYSASFGGLLVSMDTYFTYYLHNGNAIRVRYGWSAMSAGETFKVNVAQHTLGVQLMLRFNPMNRDERY